MKINYWNKTEKVLGVLGLSPYATIDFLKKLADVTPAKKDWEHIRVIMDLNTKIPSRGRCLDLNEENPSKYMNNSIKELISQGVDVIVVPCNTSHYFYDNFVLNIKIPVLNIVQETSRFILTNFPKIRNVGIMASKNTIKHGLYDKFIDKLKITIPSNQNEVSDIIENVKIGNDGKKTKKIAMNIANKLVDKGAEGIILGCTEIPPVINSDDLSVPIFDSNKILALSCLRMITK